MPAAGHPGAFGRQHASRGAGSWSTTPTCGPGWPSCTARPTGPTSRCRRPRRGRPAATTNQPGDPVVGLPGRAPPRGPGLRDPVPPDPARPDAARRRTSPGSTARSSRRCGASCSRCAAAAWARRYTTLHLHQEEEAAELLGIPDTVTQCALLPVAYTLGTDFRPADRRPVEASPTSTAGASASDRRPGSPT